MDKFWVVTLFHLQLSLEERAIIEQLAVEQFNTLGIEEFSLQEFEVDELLGERSYSGGDLPETVIDEVEERVLNKPNNYRYFFGSDDEASQFLAQVKKDFLCEAQVEECQTQDWNAEWKKH